MGLLNYEYTWFLGIFNVIGAIIGLTLINKIITKTGR
jgi:hypothetical protein